MFGSREANLFHQNVAPAVRTGSALQVVSLAKSFHRQRQWDIKLVEIATQTFQRPMERKRNGKDSLARVVYAESMTNCGLAKRSSDATPLVS